MTAASALPNRLTSATLAGADVLALDDLSAGETKGVLISDLFGALVQVPKAFETANTNAVQYEDTQLTSSGVPAAGLGYGCRFTIETAAGNNEIAGAWRIEITDATAASEDFKWVFAGMIAGAAMTDWIEFTKDGFNALTGKYYSVAGVKVVGARATGWGAASSTLSRTAYASYAGLTASVGYVQAEAQATDDALKLLSQKVAALITDLTAHGMIGA